MKHPLPQLLAILLLSPRFCVADTTNSLGRTNNHSVHLGPKHQLEAGLHYESGAISISNGLATVSLPDDFQFLRPDDARIVLEKIWSNPPGLNPLGLIVPKGEELVASNAWGVIISYRGDGYISDKDAHKIDYSELLEKLKKSTAAASEKRVADGFPSIELVGWAEPPHYDPSTHKMYWARELHFGDNNGNTLNYNIRVLGRRGVLVLNAVSSMDRFPEIQAKTADLEQMVEFNVGNRYEDFDHHTDKVAAYGLAALVAGGVVAKMGGLKLLIAGLLAVKKFVVLAFIAVVGFIKKMINSLRRRRQSPKPSASLE